MSGTRRRAIGLSAVAAVLAAAACVTHEHRSQTFNAANAGGTLRAVRTALLAYRNACGGFPATLAPLGPPSADASAGCDRLDTLRAAVRAEAWGDQKEEVAKERVLAIADIDAARPVKGYVITYRPSRPLPNGSFAAFEITAEPVERGVSGFWSLWASDVEDIHMNEERPAGPKDRAWGQSP